MQKTLQNFTEIKLSKKHTQKTNANEEKLEFLQLLCYFYFSVINYNTAGVQKIYGTVF